MRTETEIEKAIITLLCKAYDKGAFPTSYCNANDNLRNKLVKKQMLNIKKWFIKDNITKTTRITKEWLIKHNFDKIGVFGYFYSYQGGGDNFSFIVEKIKGKWYVETGDGFTNNNACGLEYVEEIEDLFFLLTGKLDM